MDLFFVLSGFLITGILLDAKGSPGYFRNFYMRRTLRIFPLYYGVLVLVFCLGPWLLPAAPAERDSSFWLWFYGGNIGAALKGNYLYPSRWFEINHFWSLAVEEQFYLVWPFVVFCLSTTNLRRMCLVCLAGALGLRFFLVGSGASHPVVWYLMPCRVDTLAAGAWLAVAVRAPGGVERLVQPARWVALGAGSVWLGIAVWKFQYGSECLDDFYVPTIGVSLLWAFFGAVLVLALPRSRPTLAGRFWNLGLLRWFGKHSYGIYVFHVLYFPILLPLTLGAFGLEGAFLQSVVYFLAMTVVASVLAWFSWNLYEQPFLQLKRFFPMGESASPGARAPPCLPGPQLAT